MIVGIVLLILVLWSALHGARMYRIEKRLDKLEELVLVDLAPLDDLECVHGVALSEHCPICDEVREKDGIQTDS